jgi:hypothetical protein
MKSNQKTRHRSHLALAALAFALGAGPALAQMSPYNETLSIDLGGIVNRWDTSVRLDGTTGRGTDINLENSGLDKSLSSFEAAASWRFFRRHRLGIDYFSAKRSGSRTREGEIDIGDQTFPVGATISAEQKTELFDIDYRYSFVQQPQFEWAFLLGFYGGTFKYDINAVGTGSTNTRTFQRQVSTTVPLPLLGLSVDWYPDPHWRLGSQLGGMKANIGDVDGHVYRFTAWGEYMFMRNWGLGGRYSYTDINVDVSKDNFDGNLGSKTSAFSLYAKFVF